MNENTIGNEIELPFNGALNWQFMLDFYRLRQIEGLEKVDQTSYFRFFELNGAKGWFRVFPSTANTTASQSPKLILEFDIDDHHQDAVLVEQVRRMFDLNTDVTQIEQHLELVAPGVVKCSGIRIPGVWNTWEAGVRAILGQQVSIKAAIGQLNLLMSTLKGNVEQDTVPCFPTPLEVANADLQFLRMPQSRKETLARFAQLMVDNPEATFDQWLALKGIGPWTISYAALRGNSEPNRFLEGDLVVKKIVKSFPSLNSQSAAPWGSYATFHCWSHAG